MFLWGGLSQEYLTTKLPAFKSNILVLGPLMLRMECDPSYCFIGLQIYRSWILLTTKEWFWFHLFSLELECTTHSCNTVTDSFFVEVTIVIYYKIKYHCCVCFSVRDLKKKLMNRFSYGFHPRSKWWMRKVFNVLRNLPEKWRYVLHHPCEIRAVCW